MTIQRYDSDEGNDCMISFPDGEWVRFSAHESAVRELEQQNQKFECNFGKREAHWISENARLEQEVERLKLSLPGTSDLYVPKAQYESVAFERDSLRQQLAALQQEIADRDGIIAGLQDVIAGRVRSLSEIEAASLHPAAGREVGGLR